MFVTCVNFANVLLEIELSHSTQAQQADARVEASCAVICIRQASLVVASLFLLGLPRGANHLMLVESLEMRPKRGQIGKHERVSVQVDY